MMQAQNLLFNEKSTEFKIHYLLHINIHIYIHISAYK